MVNLRRIILILLLSTFSYSAFPSNEVFVDGFSYVDKLTEDDDNTMTLTITINSISSTKMKQVPKVGYLEVYSILGKRVTRVKLDDCAGEIFIDLSKGLYVLKVEKTTQKVVVK